MSALPSARLASLNARSLAASTPKVSHSMSTPCFARHAAVTSPPAPVVAAALCTAWPMIVRRSAAYARPAANGPAAAAAATPDNAFRYVSARFHVRPPSIAESPDSIDRASGTSTRGADRDRVGAAISWRSSTKSRAARCGSPCMRTACSGSRPADRLEDRDVLVVDAAHALRACRGRRRSFRSSRSAPMKFGIISTVLQVERVVRRSRHRAMKVEVEIGEQVMDAVVDRRWRARSSVRVEVGQVRRLAALGGHRRGRATPR